MVYDCSELADEGFVGAAVATERQATKATRLEVKETMMTDVWCLKEDW
jgi:hypothetical protein